MLGEPEEGALADRWTDRWAQVLGPLHTKRTTLANIGISTHFMAAMQLQNPVNISRWLQSAIRTIRWQLSGSTSWSRNALPENTCP